jgi:thiosulfate reductase cytochrome b subunit
MANLAYPTPCGTAAIIPPLTDAQRRRISLREMDADVHAALIRDLIVRRQHEADQRATEALYAATEAKPNAEQAFAMAVASSVRGDDLGVVGAHFRQWVLLAQGLLVSDLVDLCDDGQRVTFGRKQ